MPGPSESSGTLVPVVWGLIQGPRSLVVRTRSSGWRTSDVTRGSPGTVGGHVGDGQERPEVPSAVVGTHHTFGDETTQHGLA